MVFDSGQPPDPIESAAKGIVIGFLTWTNEKVVDLYKKFKNKELAFVDDPKLIKNILEQKKKAEWILFKGFIKDKDLHILFRTGLSLRDLEESGENLKPHMDRIYKKYDLKGIHVAWFAQNGLFGKYFDYLFSYGLTMIEIEKEIINLFNEIDNRVFFVQRKHGTKLKTVSGEIIAKLHTFSPKIFIISSVGGATGVCEKVSNRVKSQLKDSYDFELFSKKRKNIYFLVDAMKYQRLEN